jgi:alcohol dehydrogenase
MRSAHWRRWRGRAVRMFCEKSFGTGVQMSGGHAEYMVAYADATMLLPEGLDYEQAAPAFLRRLHRLVRIALG